MMNKKLVFCFFMCSSLFCNDIELLKNSKKIIAKIEAYLDESCDIKEQVNEVKEELNETIQEDLEDSKKLQETKRELEKIKIELKETCREKMKDSQNLKRTKEEIKKFKEELEKVKEELKETSRDNLEDTKDKLKATKEKLEIIEKELENIEDEVLVDNLKGLLLVGSYEAIQPSVKDIKEIQFKDINIPGKEKNLVSKLIPLYLNKPLTYKLIDKLKKSIMEYYRSYDRPFITILVPEQEVASGILQLFVVEGKIDRIFIKNNRYMSKDKLLSCIRSKPGDHIDLDPLLTDIAWINRNPFQNANIIFSEGERESMTDIEVIIKDRFPLRVFTGADNTGSKFTGLNRWIAGFNLGNIFHENQILSYQYNSSFDFHKFQAHTLSYTSHLFYRQTFSLFGGYALVKPELIGMKSSGKSFQASIRYDMPIGKLYTHFQHGIIVGADYKTTNNNVATAETEDSVSISDNAELMQFLFNYYISLEIINYKLYFSGELFASPIRFLGHQKKSDYNPFHPGAVPRYFYIRLLLDQKIKLSYDWNINIRFEGQAAYENLLPSEQMDLGGQTTVRGYENRIITRDNAILANFEIETPSVNFLKHLNDKANDRFKILAFLDFGYGKDHKKTQGITGEKSLLSTGIGARYFIGNNVSFKFDWGYPLLEVRGNDSSKLYFQGMLSF